MAKKDQGQAEKMFKDIGKKIDELIKDLQQAKGQAKVDYADQIEELKQNAETLKTAFNNFKKDHKHRWDEAETNLHKAGSELKNAFNTLFSKKSKKEKEHK